jgi:hypothetical protein
MAGSSTHAYVVSSATAVGDVATIIGTVDTVPSIGPIAITIQMNLSALTQANTQGGITAVTQLPTGTFTQ